MQNEIILQTQDLKKYFGKVHAVDGVNLSVKSGEVYGFLGPNGSGKTTTIGMILGLLHPDSGTVALFGEEVRPNNTKPLCRVGALVGAPSLTPYLSARQNLELLARISPEIGADRISEVLEIVSLSQDAHRRTEQFSTGMRQRLGIAMSLLHKPDLLILDEPTNGMDPAGMYEIRNMIAKLSNQGVTVFLSSHLLHEVEQVCDRVAVLKKGSIVADGSVEELIGGRKNIKVRVTEPGKTVYLLKKLPGCREIRANGGYVTIAGLSSKEVLAHLVTNGVVPSEVTASHVDLESIYLALTKKETEEV